MFVSGGSNGSVQYLYKLDAADPSYREQIAYNKRIRHLTLWFTTDFFLTSTNQAPWDRCVWSHTNYAQGCMQPSVTTREEDGLFFNSTSLENYYVGSHFDGYLRKSDVTSTDWTSFSDLSTAA